MCTDKEDESFGLLVNFFSLLCFGLNQRWLTHSCTDGLCCLLCTSHIKSYFKHLLQDWKYTDREIHTSMNRQRLHRVHVNVLWFCLSYGIFLMTGCVVYIKKEKIDVHPEYLWIRRENERKSESENKITTTHIHTAHTAHTQREGGRHTHSSLS